MSNRNFSGSIALSKLVHAKFKTAKGADAIIIPIAMNNLIVGKDGAIYMPIKVISKTEEDQYGQHGFIAQSVDSKVYSAATDEQKEVYKKLPILGNIKDFSGSSNDSSGAMSTESFNEESDDLPF